MKIVMVGLGKMGQQLVEKLGAAGHQIKVIDNDKAKLAEAGIPETMIANSHEEAVSSFAGDTPIIWIMIPSSAVDEEIAIWREILPAGSIIIDGGNSDFRLTKQRAEMLDAHNIKLVDVGTSGGILGQKNGFSMMIGGDEATVKTLEPLFTALASPIGGFHYFGLSGSGHFVKMVHNAIEYGYMEALAEGYELLHQGPYSGLDLKAVSEVWQHASVIQSTLNELAGEVFAENPDLSQIEGIVAESGEARWSLDIAKEYNLNLPVTEAALNVRVASQKGTTSFATKLLVELRNKFGGHPVDKV